MDEEHGQTKQGLSRQQSASYQGAFEAVLAVPLAIGVGYWCDAQFDSEPIGLGIGALVGFGAMLLRLTRMRPPETEETEESEEKDAPGLEAQAETCEREQANTTDYDDDESNTQDDSNK